jgi:(2Fe-2S) ferredoxin
MMEEQKKQILICQNRSCKKQGSEKIFLEFLNYTSENMDIQKSGCLGHCGSGPMVLILPEEICYYGVKSYQVNKIINKHK